MIRREPARGNDAVNVGMQEQVLSPGVQDADHADLGSQVFRIGCDLQQGLCAGGEQQIVKQTRVLQGQHIEFVRHGEHDMEVAGGQEFALAGRQPALARLRLTLGAVPISDTSCRRWPDNRNSGKHRDGRPGQRCGSAEWPERL